MEYSQIPYPHNLLLAAKGGSSAELPTKITNDILTGIQYALSTLPDADQALLHLRYQQEKSPDICCVQLSLPSQQFSELERKALQKLRQPSRWGYIRHGFAGYWKKKCADAYSKGYTAGYHQGIADASSGENADYADSLLNSPIEALNLSTRAHKCLLYLKCRHIGDLINLSEHQIKHARGMGQATAAEIATSLHSHGVPQTAWDLFLP